MFDRMNRVYRLLSVPALALGCALGALTATEASAQVVANLPTQTPMLATNYFNYSSTRGVPISSVVNTPVGSDGRQATTNSSMASATVVSTDTPTPNQWRAIQVFSAVPALTMSSWQTVSNVAYLNQGTNAFSGQVGVDSQRMPVFGSGGSMILMTRCMGGGSLFYRSISYRYGDVIPPPPTDENGLALTNISPSAYWQASPYTNYGTYYSPNSKQVYATQPGQVSVTWMTSAYSTSVPSGTNYAVINGLYFTTFQQFYNCNGGTVQPPRRMYWTEKQFSSLGVLVQVPSSLVGGITIAYGSAFPANVSSEFIDPTAPSANTNQQYQETRTLWYDQATGFLHAYNTEGRVFMEILGDLNPDKTRQQLGIEIVDVLKQPYPTDTQQQLGDQLVPVNGGDITLLTPSRVNPVAAGQGAQSFFYINSAKPRIEYFAAAETRNLNDCQLWWLETGVAGMLWPRDLARYKLSWPTDPARYSHYVRPLVSSDALAQATAVILPANNSPTIQYQDPLDTPRGQIINGNQYYSFLTTNYPAHRALIRYTAGVNVAFERVYSWLDTALQQAALTPATSSPFAGTVATTLAGYTPGTNLLTFASPLSGPAVYTNTAYVGSRIPQPSGEPTNIFVGYLLTNSCNFFNANAYQDPFVVGFPAAVASSRIIPVNALASGQSKFEVLWFRPNAMSGALGFGQSYWPSALGYYTLAYPNSKTIVMASNKGSAGNGAISNYERLGRIYRQTDPTQPGYNPNEEHAMMSAGTAYALRDDLNATNGTTLNSTFTSLPYVLVEYTDADGALNMTAYKVLREDAAAGYVFDYPTPAGQLLQSPMPLPLLPPPVVNGVNYNNEPAGDTTDVPTGWTSTMASAYPGYGSFTYKDRKGGWWVSRGPNAGLPPLRVGTFTNNAFSALTNATALSGQSFALNLHASRQPNYLTLNQSSLPSWLTVSPTDGLQIIGTPPLSAVGTTNLQLIVADLWEGSRATNTLTLTVVTNGSTVTQGQLVMPSTNTLSGVSTYFTNRAPFLAYSAASSNSFQMKYYYPTDPSFDWPGNANPPAAGSVVPYLRPVGSGGAYVGDPTSRSTAPISIVYRPYWPEQDPTDNTKPVPVLEYGQTLVKPVSGLPGVGDWKTAAILYQQSIATNFSGSTPSVVLFDPTREKTSPLTNGLPSSIATQTYQGRVYFPNLPPHLSQLIYFDPTRSSLVFVGQYTAQTVGESYLSLNVLNTNDQALVSALCDPADTQLNYWTASVANLSTTIQTFVLTNGNWIAPLSTDATNNINYGIATLPYITSENQAVSSKALTASGPGSGYVTLVESGGAAFTQPGDPVALHILRVGGSLHRGELKVITPPNPLSEMVTFQHTVDMGGNFNDYEYQWKIAAPIAGQPPVQDATMSMYQQLVQGTGLPRYLLGGAGIQVLGDNYVTLRYRPTNPANPLYNQWSSWTSPVLVQGWIKRVLAGINPFNQRTANLFDNAVNMSSSMLTQAGHRWEGAVALNQDTLNNYGLIEIYQTVLQRGQALSINSGYNYGPANQALLLAAGYINDLYMMVGNEAWADAANPTIGIGTDSSTYGSVATSLFSFMGQEPSLLEEELALDRGRDDVLVPGVKTAPVYNRLVWNFTMGIGTGQTIYQQNYNVTDQNSDGIVDALDGSIMYPMGHGDAYGHYLTALTGYYNLLMNPNFDWVPQPESVSILGMPVSVNFMHERKFASSAVAMARTGRQVFDLTWRRDYLPGHTTGWGNLSLATTNTAGSLPFPDSKFWGADHWASRTGQGSYLNWLAGNAILPDVDTDSTHKGTIQQVDRTTVPELNQLATMATDIQTAMDNAEAGLNPLGMTPGTVALDIDPNQVVGGANNTHFEQIYNRALVALNNAVASFDDAKNVTQLMRSQEDSLSGLQAQVAADELAFTNSLIELYGTPYSDDIGAGKTYPQGYSGPDLLHYMYCDDTGVYDPGNAFAPNAALTAKLDFQINPTNYDWNLSADGSVWVQQYGSDGSTSKTYTTNNCYVSYSYSPNQFWVKPSTWTGSRYSPGKIQQAASKFIQAQNDLWQSLANATSDKEDMDKQLQLFQAQVSLFAAQNKLQDKMDAINIASIQGQAVADIAQRWYDAATADGNAVADAMKTIIPKNFVAGLAFGTDGPGNMMAGLLGIAHEAVQFSMSSIFNTMESAWTFSNAQLATALIVLQNQMSGSGQNLQLQQAVVALANQQKLVQGHFQLISTAAQKLSDAMNNYKTCVAQGDRIQAERLANRRKTAALIQGFRNRDAAFRVFRNEKLERYKTLFDMASRYAYLAANAYDFETGLLNTSAGRSYLNKIVNSRALGVVQNGIPQYGGSSNGDPGLSTALAQMKADWDIVKGRLGFNNPDVYGTTTSMRAENYKIGLDTNNLSNWQDILNKSRVPDLLADADVVRNCLQISKGTGVAVPGIVIPFSTSITDGCNLFGLPLGSGDHNFISSAFATKIFAIGVAFPGYQGMDNPPANLLPSSVTPPDPNLFYTYTNGLAATPIVYLIPCGQDVMRTPPLGDTATLRNFSVDDVAIPLPFNIGAAQFASGGFYQTSDALLTPLFAVRKHQAFRPVSDPACFSQNLYGQSGTLMRSQFTNNRLIGRSAWNTKWKLVIPGYGLLADPTVGLDRFIQTVTDIKLHFDTYSYSGN